MRTGSGMIHHRLLGVIAEVFEEGPFGQRSGCEGEIALGAGEPCCGRPRDSSIVRHGTAPYPQSKQGESPLKDLRQSPARRLP